MPVPGGDNAGTGWTPDNGLVSWGVDAVAVCPISGGYRTFASSQSPGNADRFPLPHSIHRRSVNSGSIALAFAGGALSDTERSSRNQVDPGFQAWCDGGHSAHWPGDEPWKVGLLPAALLAMHRVEAPAKPGLAFRSATPRDREAMTGARVSFCRLLAREGVEATKFPIDRKPSALRARGKPGGGGALACSPVSLSGPAETGSAWAAAGQFCGWQAPSIGAHGRLGPCRGLGHNVYGISSLAQTSGSSSAGL